MTTINVGEDSIAVTAAVGDTVVVRLPEPGATGHQWAVEIDGESVVEAYSTLQVVEEGPVAPGSGAVRLVGLRAERPGSCDVVFRLHLPWEEGALRSRALRIEVVE